MRNTDKTKSSGQLRQASTEEMLAAVERHIAGLAPPQPGDAQLREARDPKPPPMVPSAEKRAINELAEFAADGFFDVREDAAARNIRHVKRLEAAFGAAYLDGWDAALAAQQPAPEFNMPPTSHVPASPVPCPRTGNNACQFGYCTQGDNRCYLRDFNPPAAPKPSPPPTPEE